MKTQKEFMRELYQRQQWVDQAVRGYEYGLGVGDVVVTYGAPSPNEVYVTGVRIPRAFQERWKKTENIFLSLSPTLDGYVSRTSRNPFLFEVPTKQLGVRPDDDAKSMRATLLAQRASATESLAMCFSWHAPGSKGYSPDPVAHVDLSRLRAECIQKVLHLPDDEMAIMCALIFLTTHRSLFLSRIVRRTDAATRMHVCKASRLDYTEPSSPKVADALKTNAVLGCPIVYPQHAWPVCVYPCVNERFEQREFNQLDRYTGAVSDATLEADIRGVQNASFLKAAVVASVILGFDIHVPSPLTPLEILFLQKLAEKKPDPATAKTPFFDLSVEPFSQIALEVFK